jgi:hypothetical protein
MALVLMLSSLVVVGLGSQALALPDQQATLSVGPAQNEVYRGEEFTVEIRVDDVEDLWGYQFTLRFNPAVVSVTDVEDAGFLGPEADIFGPEYDTGLVTFGAGYLETPTDPPDGPGVLATVTLKAEALGRSPLALVDPQLFPDGELAVPQVTDGVVNSIVEMEVSPASAEEWVNPGVFTEQILIHGAKNLAGFRFDLAFDPAVVQVDSVALGPFLGSSGRTPGTPFEDIDNTTGMLTFEAFSTGTMDGPDGSGVLATVTFTALAKGDTDLDLEGLRVFDPEANEENPEDADGILHVVEQGVQVTPLTQSVNRCDTFDVWIYVADANDLAGFKFDLAWDETLFTVDDIVADEAFLTQNGRTVDFVLAEVDNDNGTLNFEAATLGDPGTGVDGLGPMAHLTVTAIGVGTSDLTLSDVFLYDSEGAEERPTLTDGEATATKEAVKFAFSTIGDQVTDVPFDVTITALNEDDQPAVNFSGKVDLSDTTGTLSPTQVEFDGPVATASMTITDPGTDVKIMAEAVNPCGVTITGESNTFDVCQPVEIVSLTSDSPVELGTAMNFTAVVEGSEPYDYSWDFGDGGAGTLLAGGEETGTYLFADYGFFTVTLTVDNACGTDTETLVVEVTCDGVEIVDFTSDSPVTLDDPMNFTATVEGTEPYDFSWDFGDGGSGTLLAGGEETGSYLFAEYGTYTVMLTVDNPCGTDTETLVVQVEPYRLFMPIIMNNYSP